MTEAVLGLHHVTAISSDPQATFDFYTNVLGLRLVKLTVNYDDPGTYHLYFGDEVGRPGNILTFFPWPDQPLGRKGTGQLTTTSFSIARSAIDYWKDRLRSHGIVAKDASGRFGDSILSFADEDGQGLELIASEKPDERAGWKKGLVPVEYAIKGFHSVTLAEEILERTESVLLDTLGFRHVGEEENRFRYEAGRRGAGTIVDIVSQPKLARGIVSVGTVHHVAFRAANDEHQKALREEILKTNLHVTDVINRFYFRSIYFREPGGILLEVATDPPGFTVDEPLEQLGSGLMLPPWLEASREEIRRNLPRVRLPSTIAAYQS